MSDSIIPEQASDAVRVIESIPVQGDNQVSARDASLQKIPLPAHLRLFPAFARGGVGHVHAATDRHLLRHVALKRLDQEFVGERFYREGFIAEAQMAGQLEHPNIVPVHELSIDERGVPYFTMKLVQGLSFDDWLHSPKRAVGMTERLEEGIEILLKVCDAVGYAHHRGVIHRDLKPANIMVASFGQVYLMDWGLARLTKTAPASGERSQMNAVGPVGTPDYMAPEQARGNPLEMDERSDVFGLGAILYELVTGARPYGDEPDAHKILDRAARGAVIPVEQAGTHVGLTKRIVAIINRAVAAHPEHRYPSVGEFRDDLRRYLLGGMHLPRVGHKPGTLLMREGEPGESAYMIVSGRCRAFRTVNGTQETLAIMEAGEVFGEMALILDEPRAASVEAIDQVTLLVLDRTTMTEGLGLEGWSGALVRALAQRFRKLEQTFRESGIRRA